MSADGYYEAYAVDEDNGVGIQIHEFGTLEEAQQFFRGHQARQRAEREAYIERRMAAGMTESDALTATWVQNPQAAAQNPLAGVKVVLAKQVFLTLSYLIRKHYRSRRRATSHTASRSGRLFVAGRI